MTALNTILVLVAAYVIVFLEAAFSGVSHWLGTQIDLLPALMVYASLSSNFVTIPLLAVCGGLWMDSLSANPLGVSILPLFVIGFLIYQKRELILRNQPFAQISLGAAASAIAPLLTVLLVLTAGKNPLLGWGSLWQWIVMTAAGAMATPVLFRVFDLFDNALNYRRATETSFRTDREIRRGRN